MGAGGVVVLVLLALVLVIALAALQSAVNIVQQGQVGVVKRLGEYQRDPRARAGHHRPVHRQPAAGRHARDPAPGRPPGGHHQGQRGRHGERHDLHPDRRRQAGAVQRVQLRHRHRRAGPHRAAIGDRHDDPRPGAVRAGAHQHRRAGSRWRSSPTSGASASAASRSSRSPRRRRSSRRWPCRRRPTRRSGPRSCSPRALQQVGHQRGRRRRAKPPCRRPRAQSQAAILHAEGNRQAAILEAEGRAQAIETVYDAITERQPRPDAGRHPPARHAGQVRRQRQRQDRWCPTRASACSAPSQSLKSMLGDPCRQATGQVGVSRRASAAFTHAMSSGWATSCAAGHVGQRVPLVVGRHRGHRGAVGVDPPHQAGRHLHVVDVVDVRGEVVALRGLRGDEALAEVVRAVHEVGPLDGHEVRPDRRRAVARTSDGVGAAVVEVVVGAADLVVALQRRDEHARLRPRRRRHRAWTGLVDGQRRRHGEGA